MQIAPMLRIGRGLTALVGGGGKTTLLYTLTEELRGKGSVILCTSTHIRVPESYPLVTGDGDALKAALKEHGAVCAGTRAEGGKLTAPPLSFRDLTALADYVLVEADGAGGLPLKAHAGHEPVIPAEAQRVVLVLGASGFGRPIAEVCHRPELYAQRAGVAADTPVTPALACRVIQAEGCGDRVYINQVETAEGYAAAEDLANRLTCPVAAGSLRQGVYTAWRV